MAYESSGANWENYKKAVVDVQIGDETVTVGPRGIESDTSARPNPGDLIHLITAYNPGRLLGADENAERQQALEQELDRRGLEIWPAIGRDRRRKHGEPSLAVRGLTQEEARRVGLLYGQDAIFEWTHDSWAIVPCGAGMGYVFRDGLVVATPWLSDLLLLDRLLGAGLTFEQALLFEAFELTPDRVTGPPADALGFLKAAEYQGLDPHDVQSLLERAGGDTDIAWELWADDEGSSAGCAVQVTDGQHREPEC